MTVAYTEERNFPLPSDGCGNWGAIINGVLEALDAGHELTLTFGETVTAGCVIALKASDGKAYKSVATDATLTPAIGIAPDAVTAGNEGRVRGFGWIDVDTGYADGSLSFNAGDAVYVGTTAGQLAKTRQSWSGPVGWCKNPSNASYETRIFIQPRPRQAEMVNQLCVEKQAHFAQEVSHGNLGAIETINWTAGNKQAGIVNNDCDLSFTAPSGPCNVVMRLIGDAVGGHTITWPVAVKWQNGTAGVISSSAGKTDIFCAYYDGSKNYYGSLATSFE